MNKMLDAERERHPYIKAAAVGKNHSDDGI
jgi:hypothetical protein